MKLKKILELITRRGGGRKYTISEIKYFSTDGRTSVPNGHVIQKGGFLSECHDNKEKFKTENYQYFIDNSLNIVEAIPPNQYGMADYRGGVVLFSNDVNSVDVSRYRILNWAKRKFKSHSFRFFSKSRLNKVITNFNQDDKMLDKVGVEDYIGAFSIGNFFSGRYIGDNKKVFDEKSLSIEINGMSSKGLIYLAEEFAMEFEQEIVLVKDLNKNKYFLVHQDRNGSYDVNDIKKNRHN